ncbi:hypothetical protein F4678DRAFT_185752 [Xylaria arbuscula]|nr:hypothetical protein F4678DRAFT_185752 [Xylaria arbuscula]
MKSCNRESRIQNPTIRIGMSRLGCQNPLQCGMRPQCGAYLKRQVYSNYRGCFDETLSLQVTRKLLLYNAEPAEKRTAGTSATKATKRNTEAVCPYSPAQLSSSSSPSATFAPTPSNFSCNSSISRPICMMRVWIPFVADKPRSRLSSLKRMDFCMLNKRSQSQERIYPSIQCRDFDSYCTDSGAKACKYTAESPARSVCAHSGLLGK